MRATWTAAAVHLFTALGALCALFALMAVLSQDWERAFIWLGIALLVDGIDGTFARMANVSAELPRFSGERLDLVIDYLTYVFVPALAMLLGGFLQGGFGMLLVCLVLLASLFHFSDTESKTADNCFVGFPALWNVVAFYLFALATPQWLASVIVACLVALTFVPLKWAHPMRTPLLWPVTVLAIGAWGVAALLTLWRGFPATTDLQAILVAVAAYYGGLVLYRSLAR